MGQHALEMEHKPMALNLILLLLLVGYYLDTYFNYTLEIRIWSLHRNFALIIK